MSNVKTVPNCPQCGTFGAVIGHKGIFVSLACFQCNFKWNTISMLCKDCKKPNGYAVEGLCKYCYVERYMSS